MGIEEMCTGLLMLFNPTTTTTTTATYKTPPTPTQQILHNNNTTYTTTYYALELLAELWICTRHQLVENVVGTFRRRYRYHPGALEQVCVDRRPSHPPPHIKIHLHKLAKTTRVVVSTGFGIPKGLQEGVALKHLLLHWCRGFIIPLLLAVHQGIKARPDASGAAGATCPGRLGGTLGCCATAGKKLHHLCGWLV